MNKSELIDVIAKDVDLSKVAPTTVPRFTAGAGFKTAVAGKKATKKKRAPGVRPGPPSGGPLVSSPRAP